MEKNSVLRIPKPSNILHVHRNISYFYHFVFFIFGVSLGTVATLYLKTFSFHLQYFLYHANPDSSSQPLYQIYQPQPAPPPAPPAKPEHIPLLLSNNNTTMIRSTSDKVSLMHNMTDQELFLEAIKVRGVVGVSNKKSPNKVAFMFLANGPLPLGPLWERFFKGHEGLYTIYLHQHPSFNETVPQDSVFFGRRIPSQVSCVYNTIT